MVSVPEGVVGSAPWASRLISLDAAWSHLALSAPILSCLYSKDAPVAVSITECAVHKAWAGKAVGMAAGDVGGAMVGTVLGDAVGVMYRVTEWGVRMAVLARLSVATGRRRVK
jgi:hypothetical protein